MSRYIHVFEEAGNTQSLSSNTENSSKQDRGPEPGLQTNFSNASNIDQGQPRKCPNCQKLHHGSSQLQIFCCECEHDKIKAGELNVPENPQYSQERETW